MIGVITRTIRKAKTREKSISAVQRYLKIYWKIKIEEEALQRRWMQQK